MTDLSTKGFRDLLLQIFPDGDFKALYEVHKLAQKFFFNIQVFYTFFFVGLMLMYFSIAGIGNNIHSVFVITISLLASTLFATEAYRSWKVASLFSNGEVFNSVSHQSQSK